MAFTDVQEISTGKIFSDAVAVCKRNAWLLFPLAFCFQSLPIVLLKQFFPKMEAYSHIESPGHLFSHTLLYQNGIVGMLLSITIFVLSVFVSACIIKAVHEDSLDRKPQLAELFHFTLRRLPALLGNLMIMAGVI